MFKPFNCNAHIIVPLAENPVGNTVWCVILMHYLSCLLFCSILFFFLFSVVLCAHGCSFTHCLNVTTTRRDVSFVSNVPARCDSILTCDGNFNNYSSYSKVAVCLDASTMPLYYTPHAGTVHCCVYHSKATSELNTAKLLSTYATVFNFH